MFVVDVWLVLFEQFFFFFRITFQLFTSGGYAQWSLNTADRPDTSIFYSKMVCSRMRSNRMQAANGCHCSCRVPTRQSSCGHCECPEWEQKNKKKRAHKLWFSILNANGVSLSYYINIDQLKLHVWCGYWRLAIHFVRCNMNTNLNWKWRAMTKSWLWANKWMAARRPNKLL